MSQTDTSTRTSPPPPASSSSALMAAALGGAAVASVAGFIMASRLGRSAKTTEQTLSRLLQEVERNTGIVQKAQAGTIDAKTFFSTSLQSQERAIGQNLQTVVAARQQLDNVTNKIQNLENIFISPKKRGTFGELQLEGLIKDVMPPNAYSFQHAFSNGTRVDCLLHLPSPIGKLSVDSKFPLDAFQVNSNHDDGDDSPEQQTAQRKAYQAGKLRESLKKHIADIRNKYIIPGETADFAIMFLPSEGLFLQLVQEHPHIVQEANRNKIWLACPTTLLAVLTTLQGVTRGMAMEQSTNEVLGHVQKLSENVKRLEDRFEKAKKHVDQAQEQLRQMQISMDKVQGQKSVLEIMGAFSSSEKGNAAAATTTSRKRPVAFNGTAGGPAPNANAATEASSDDDHGTTPSTMNGDTNESKS